MQVRRAPPVRGKDRVHLRGAPDVDGRYSSFGLRCGPQAREGVLMPDLPSEPSLQQLRHQARDLQRAVRSGAPDALAEVAERHPGGRPGAAAAAAFPLSAAQLVVARRYDFPSWVRLRRYVEVVERYSRFPARMAEDQPSAPADQFLTLDR